MKLAPITKTEHDHIIKHTDDSIGYCYEMFKLKARVKVSIGTFASDFKTWVRIASIGKHDLMTGAEHIRNYFIKKFA